MIIEQVQVQVELVEVVLVLQQELMQLLGLQILVAEEEEEEVMDQLLVMEEMVVQELLY